MYKAYLTEPLPFAVGIGGRRTDVGFFPLLHGLPKDELDLAIHAAQFIGRPSFQLSPECGVNPQEK